MLMAPLACLAAPAIQSLSMSCLSVIGALPDKFGRGLLIPVEILVSPDERLSIAIPLTSTGSRTNGVIMAVPSRAH